MSGRFGDALATRVMVGVVVKPCGMLKVVVEPSPVRRISPPFFSRGVLWSSWSKASTTRFHSSGVRICGKSRSCCLLFTPLLYMSSSIYSFIHHLILWVLVVVFWFLVWVVV
jgi:hypothetical protein